METGLFWELTNGTGAFGPGGGLKKNFFSTSLGDQRPGFDHTTVSPMGHYAHVSTGFQEKEAVSLHYKTL